MVRIWCAFGASYLRTYARGCHWGVTGVSDRGVTGVSDRGVTGVSDRGVSWRWLAVVGGGCPQAICRLPYPQLLGECVKLLPAYTDDIVFWYAGRGIHRCSDHVKLANNGFG